MNNVSNNKHRTVESYNNIKHVETAEKIEVL